MLGWRGFSVKITIKQCFAVWLEMTLDEYVELIFTENRAMNKKNKLFYIWSKPIFHFIIE